MLALAVEPVQRALPALFAQFERIDRVEIWMPEMLERLEFDRQAVHVPAGDELRVLAVEQRDLHEHVLEDHVQEVAHVELAVGVRRPVVQDPRAARGVALQAPLVRAALLPPATRSGSRLGSSAFIGKSVFGRFRVSR